MKEYKSITNQINYLKDDKKIVVDDGDRNVFIERNYISLVNPYKVLFASGTTQINNELKHIYEDETNLKELIKIAKIDDSFSCLLHKWIGYFERKLKSILFYELASLYAENENNDSKDAYCINYANDIKVFIDSNYSQEKLPIFCKQYFEMNTSHGYVHVDYIEGNVYLQQRENVLKHIYEVGTGNYIYTDGENTKTAKLTRHFIDKGEIVPLWVIPACLTFGELQTVFNIAPRKVQQMVYCSFIPKEGKTYEDVSSKELLKFSGYLETIRNARNVINHYEPVLPYVSSVIGDKAKTSKPSQFMKTIDLLKSVHDNSIIERYSEKPTYKKSDYNKLERKSLEYMIYILNQNKQ